jgi:hypothetical protein
MQDDRYEAALRRCSARDADPLEKGEEAKKHPDTHLATLQLWKDEIHVGSL